MSQYVSVAGAIAFTSMALLALLVSQSDLLDTHRKKLFLCVVGFTALETAIDTATILLSSCPPSFRIANVTISAFGFAISPCLPLLMAFVVGNRRDGLRPAILLPLGINALCSLLSIWFPVIFSVDVKNSYRRETFFWVFIAAFGFYLVYFVRRAAVMASTYPRRTKIVLWALLVFMICGMSTETFIPGFPFMWITISFSLLIYYAYLCEQSDRYDILTDLYNRRTYENELIRLETKEYAAIVLFDVNRFKRVNDTYGHPYGDACLNKLAVILREVFEGIGDCYRIGGDEFCMITRTASVDTIRERLKALDRIVESARGLDAHLPSLSAGIGVYRRNEGGKPSDAVHDADGHLYEEKKARKKRDLSGETDERLL